MDRKRGTSSSPKYMKLGEVAERCVEGTDDKECEASLRHKTGDVVDTSTERIDRTGQENDSVCGISEETEGDTILFEKVTMSASSGQDRFVVKPVNLHNDRVESLHMMIIEIVIPFFCAGFGMMAAGLLLDAVQVSFLGS